MQANLEDDRQDGDERRRRDRDDDRRDRYRDRGQPDLGLAGLLAKPEVLAAVSTLAQLGGLSPNMMGGGGFGQVGNQILCRFLSNYREFLFTQVGGGMGRSRSSYGSSSRSRDDDRRDMKRSKFAPYQNLAIQRNFIVLYRYPKESCLYFQCSDKAPVFIYHYYFFYNLLSSCILSPKQCHTKEK